MKSSNFKTFNYLENGEIMFSEYETVKTTQILDSGSYLVDYIGYPEHRVSLSMDKNIETSKSFTFPEKEQIDSLFDSFFNKDNKEKIEKLGFCHKFGLLFNGIEGGGKSSIIKHYYTRAIEEHNAIVFHLVHRNSYVSQCWNFIQSVRSVQSNPIIVVIDEIDNNIDNLDALYKTIIDGNLSISNCIFLAATNHIDRISKALKDRPSRFKYNITIDGIKDETYIKNIISYFLSDLMTDSEITKLAKKLSGETLDVIKNYCMDEILKIQHYGKKRSKISLMAQSG